MISVIVPVRTIPPEFVRFRECVRSSIQSVEIIYVVSKGLENSIHPIGSHERVLASQRVGRGYAMVQAARQARGDIILFLHADTLLPEQWDRLLVQALVNPSVVGGGFRLRFDRENRYLKLLVKLSDMMFRVTGEMWGDRAIFLRSDTFRACFNTMDVPIMEDVRLSYCMKGKGRVILLDAVVCTSVDSFHRRGMVCHTMRILLCRSMYSLGFPLELIWKCYYGKFKRK